MKFPFKVVFFSLAILGSALAETIPEGKGAVGFVNAVPLDTPTEIFILGTSLRPEGFPAGEVTGFLLFSSRPIGISAKNGDIVAKEEPLTVLMQKASTSIVYYVETLLDSGEKKKELKILSVPGGTKADGINQRAILVGASTPQTFMLNGVSTTLTPYLPTASISTGSLKIETPKGHKLAEFNAGESGNYLAVIYPDLKGGFACTWKPDSL